MKKKMKASTIVGGATAAGMATVGGVVGGGMAAGAIITAAAPIAIVGGLCYGALKLFKK